MGTSLNYFVINVPQFLGSDTVRKLNFKQQGIYLRLLVEYWNGHCDGLIWERLRSNLGFKWDWKGIRFVLCETFREVDGRWHNTHALHLWNTACDKQRRQSEGGRRGALSPARLQPSCSLAATSSSTGRNTLLYCPRNTRKATSIPQQDREGPFSRKEEPKNKNFLLDPIAVVERLHVEWPDSRTVSEREIRGALVLAARCVRQERFGKLKDGQRVWISCVRRGDTNTLFRGATQNDEAKGRLSFAAYQAHNANIEEGS